MVTKVVVTLYRIDVIHRATTQTAVFESFMPQKYLDNILTTGFEVNCRLRFLFSILFRTIARLYFFYWPLGNMTMLLFLRIVPYFIYYRVGDSGWLRCPSFVEGLHEHYR